MKISKENNAKLDPPNSGRIHSIFIQDLMRKHIESDYNTYDKIYHQRADWGNHSWNHLYLFLPADLVLGAYAGTILTFSKAPSDALSSSDEFRIMMPHMSTIPEQRFDTT